MLTIIDFESYFDQKYNLKKLNMIEYIHDDRFEVLGAAILVPELNLHAFLPDSEFESWLSELDPNDTEVLAHNTLFDGAILAWRYGFNPKRWLDSISMARAKLPITSHSLAALATHYQLPSKGKLNTQSKHWIDLSRQERADLTTYAKHDAWLCHQIYQKLSPFPETELELIDITIRLFTEPKFQLDTQKAHELLTKEKTKKKTQLQSTGLTATQLNSNQQLAEIIREHGLEPPTKISLRTGEETYAFAKDDEDFIEFIEAAPEPLQNILTARIALKSGIVETRLQRLLNVQNAAGSLPVPLTYHGAHTGRWSGRGAGLNMQNLPKKDDFREILLAPPNHLLVVADSASIEARVLAWLAGQQDLLEIFWQKGDPYKTMAAAIYGKPETEITKKERTLGKVAVLGCIAEGELVSTQRGLIPIEEIQLTDKVWDGLDWTSHEGLLDQGIQKVIYQDRLWATPDHVVYISNRKQTLTQLELALHRYKTAEKIPTKITRVYDLLNAGPRHRFTVSGRLVSNCGYGMGASKFQATAKKPPYSLDIDFYTAQLAVNTYRQTNKAVVNLWRFLDNMIHFMQKQTKRLSMIPQSIQTEQHYKCLTFCKEEIKLPNGLSLYYPNLRYEENEYRYGHKQKTYGGALCIAGETNILTNNGLKKLINLNNNDLLWDGQNWVVHGGLIYKGLKQTINFGNIYMTPEHRVWTTTGWCKADETTFNSARQAFLAQSKKPTRLNFWQCVSNTLRRIKWPKDLMESRMYSLRLDKNIEFNRPTAGQILWMPTKTVHQYCPKNTWNDENPYLRYISKYDRPLQITYTPSLEKLRGARNRSRRYVEKFYSFLQRYVSNLPTRSYFRQNQQQWELFQGKLPLGNLRAKREQQTNKQIHRHAPRKNDYSTSGSILWNRNNHTTLSNQSGHSKKPTIHQTQCTKPVYDIMNSGPNHCFTVLNPRGEAILVHNCENIVQALARIVVSDQVRATHKAGYPMALLVHDEIVCCVPETQAEQCSKDLHNIMCQPPDWAQDMPLDAEEVISPKYIKP
jgi:DNA polymerase I-like protein with 3'-5' exonuclease and polymerase domains